MFNLIHVQISNLNFLFLKCGNLNVCIGHNIIDNWRFFLYKLIVQLAHFTKSCLLLNFQQKGQWGDRRVGTDTYLDVNTEPFSGWDPVRLLTPGGSTPLWGERGEVFLSSSDKGLYLLFDSLAVFFLLCFESPVRCCHFWALGAKSHQFYKIFLQLFVIFHQISLPLGVFLQLFLTCLEHGLEAAAPRYSPTKTHSHASTQFGKKELEWAGAGPGGGSPGQLGSGHAGTRDRDRALGHGAIVASRVKRDY